MDGRTYVTDYVGDEHLRWENGSRIIISTPTGSGKTTFVVATLLKYAVEQKKHIVSEEIILRIMGRKPYQR